MYRKPIASGIVLLLILSIIIPMVVGFDTLDEGDNGLMDSAWPMKCHDTRHTGRSPYSTEDNHGVEKWRFNCDWVEGGSVIGEDGTIYFGDFNYYLYAMNPDGTLKWKYKTGGLIWSTPAIGEDGTIYIGSYDNKLYAINQNGSLRWKFNAGGGISSSPTIAEDGTIYFGTMKGFDKGEIYAVNPNGTEKWSYETDYLIVSDPAIGDNGTIYIGSGDSYLYAMNPDGTLQWRFKTGDWVKAHPSIAEDGTIYISSFDNFLYALNPNGTLRWNYSGGGDTASVSIDEDGTIYLGNAYLHAIYPNGTRKWRIDVGSNIDHASPAISSDGTIYIGAGKYIISINLDGTERWRKKIANDWVESSPCIAEDGTVYIGSTDHQGSGSLHAFVTGFNNPPDKPNITGPSSGKIGTFYNYTFVTTDPDEDDIYLFVDWGNGQDRWIGPFHSGEEVILSRIWYDKGPYTIQAKAKDTYYDYESDWATLNVTMPKNKAISSPFIQFLENHPRLFPILRHVLKGR